MRPFLKRAAAAAVSFVICSPLALAQEAPPASESVPESKLLAAALSLSDNAEGHAAQVAFILESAARRSKRHVYVDPFVTYDPDGVVERAENRRKAEDALSFGRKQYEALEDRHGLESFNRAIALYEHTGLWNTFDKLIEANVMRLLVTWPQDRTIGRREIERLVVMAPRVEFPPDLTSPELAADVKRAKDLADGETKVSIDISSDPVSARVYVDGVYRGTAPTTVRGLLPGEHYVSFVAPGYEVVQRTVLVSAGSTATETLKPVEGAEKFLSFLDRMRDNFRETEEVAAAKVLARSAGADEVVVAGVSRVGSTLTIEMHRIIASDGHVVAIEVLKDVHERDPDLAQKIDALASRVLANDRSRDGDKPRGVKTQGEKIITGITNVSGESVRLVVGISAATLVTTGVVLGFVSRSKEADLRPLQQLDPRVEDLRSSGSSMALGADILVGAGLVAGSVWAWMQFGSKARAKGELAPDAAPGRRQAPEKKKEPEKKKDDGAWDPWAREDSAPAWVRPTIGFGHVGLEGGF